MILFKILMVGTELDAYKLIYFDKIPSTQDQAYDLIASGSVKNRTVIVANTQTSGRGRFKRNWVSRPGNLYASFIYKIDEHNPKIAYSVGVAVAETLISFGITPQIKWPNDILVDGKKISGILIEYAQNFVIIGIGVNIANCPKIKDYKTTKINNFTDASVSDVLNVLMKKIDKWTRCDFKLVRGRWMELAFGINKIITYHGDSFELIGINETGALVLRKDTKYILTYGDEISI